MSSDLSGVFANQPSVGIPKELLGEAVKQLRNILALLVTTSLVWLVTVEAVRSSLQTRERAKHIAAWLLIRDTFHPFASELVNLSDAQPVTCFPREVQIQSGTEVQVCDPFEIVSPWHAEARIKMSLLPVANVKRAMRVNSTSTVLPVDHYSVTNISSKVDVLPTKLVTTQRDLGNAVLRDSLATPEYWPATRMHLFARGWTGRTPKDLQLADSTVASFIRDGFSASYTISGIPFAPGAFPAAVAAFIGLLGFLLIGPLLVIRRAVNPPESDPWVFLACAQGRGGLVLSVGQFLLSLAVVALPLLILASQFSLFEYLSTWERAAWVPFSALLIFVSAVLAACAHALWVWRSAR